MKKVLFLGNHFVALYSYRKELIKRLVENGNEVYLSLPESDENRYFTDMGCIVISTPIDRRGINPLKDFKLIRFYRKMIKEINPNIIFSYTIKPNIYGAIANNGRCKQICNITGTGAIFLKKNLLSSICTLLYKVSVKRCYKIFFQNTGDCEFFKKNNMVNNNYEILPGSGCNLEEHPYCEMPDKGELKFIFIGRIMKLKGIDEFLRCAEIIKKEFQEVTFYIAGWYEDELYREIVSDYERRGIVKYIGYRKDINEWIEKCHCTILPSHGGEGVPNVLLETAAMGRICVASNIHGSRDVVQDGQSGFLFKAGDAGELAECVRKIIIMSDEERSSMGKLGRKKIEKEFDRTFVINKYLGEMEKV